MIVKPKVRGFICTTAHPQGCAQHVQEQINYVRSREPISGGPKNALVIGSSTGYGLASRVVASFGGSKAGTIGVFFEKEAEGKRTATAGYYNSVAFEEKANDEGIYAKSFNGDAYSDEMKNDVCAAIKKDLGKIDLLVYSLAAPRRKHPRTGEVHKSVLRPVGGPYTNKSIDLNTNELEEVTLPAATEEEVRQTVSVMGGEDWEFWIDALEKNDLIDEGFKTVAYSYIGPEITRAVYRKGTIGAAKDHLEVTAKKLNERLQSKNGEAVISVNKALVTQSSSAIPFIPLYFVLLKKVMKEKGVEEDCIGQIYRLFKTQLYAPPGTAQRDPNGFIRMDDLEMRADVQEEVQQNWEKLNNDNLAELADLEGYHEDFLRMFGFGIDGVDYEEDVEIERPIPSQV